MNGSIAHPCKNALNSETYKKCFGKIVFLRKDWPKERNYDIFSERKKEKRKKE